MIQFFISKILGNPSTMGAAIVVAALGALGFAFFMQYERGLDPCHLCLLQRWPYGLAALFGLTALGASLSSRTRLAGAVIAGAAFVFLAEAGLAFYHVGVEKHWWVSIFESCMIAFPKGGDLVAQIMAKPPARCDEIAWKFLGLSMAAWNMLLALGLTGLCAASALLIGRKTKK